jgi:hypothetical protein
VPTKVRWLLAIPDAIAQLETLDRDLLIRRDLEQLFGISKARAEKLMLTFGAERTGNARTLGRVAFLRQLRALQKGRAFKAAVVRRERLITTLRTARIASVRVQVSSSVLSGRLSGLPAGVVVECGRIEVRFSGARDAVGRLFALAKALTNDYERFEALVAADGPKV